jgi:hypothetical protein
MLSSVRIQRRHEVLPKTFTDEELAQVVKDPVLWQKLRNTNIVFWEELERRALRLGLVLQLFQGEAPPKKRGVTWEDPQFYGF